MRYRFCFLILLPLLSCKDGGSKSTEEEEVLEAPEGLGDLVGRSFRFTSNWKFNLGDVEGAEAPGFNDEGWEDVTLPHDWSIHLDFNEESLAGGGGGFLDGGVGWYRKTFSVSGVHEARRLIVRFDGVYMNAEVWVNGERLGLRPNGYIWFEYDLTDYVHFGGSENVIAVRANNEQPSSRWYSGSGIYRNVWLTMLSPVHIPHDGYFVSTPEIDESSAVVQVQSEVRNVSGSAASVTLETDIVDPDGETAASHTSDAETVAAGDTAVVDQSISVDNPQRWTLDEPVLYTAVTDVIRDGTVVDTFESQFGFRTFRLDADTGFYLNDVNMKINGVCLHHDLGALGAAFNTRAMEKRLEMMKAMGANAVRTAHNPADPALLDIADRTGLLVQEEAFDAWQEDNKAENDYHLYFDEWHEADIRAMVRRDRNHPSIIMWSIGNEIHDIMPDSGFPGVETTRALMSYVKEEDDTRPVTMGSNYAGWATEASGLLDMVGINYNVDWYDELHTRYPEWKLYASETASAVRSRGVYYTPTSENILPEGNEDLDHQLSSYDNSVVSWGASAEESWRLVNTREHIAGEFVWTGYDYIGEPTPFGWPSKSSYFGIVDTAGFPKDIYYFYQSKWTNAPMVHLLPHWNWEDGDTIEVWAYTNAESVELFLNEVSLGELTYPTSPEEPQHLVWNVPFEPGTLRAEAIDDNRVVAAHEITTAGEPAKIELAADREEITTDGRDLVFVETNILDADDNFVPTADNEVDFEVEGPGEIVGVDNGNAASVEPFKASRRLAFNGKCLVIVRSTGKAGEIKVTAASDGLTTAEVTVQAE